LEVRVRPDLRLTASLSAPRVAPGGEERLRLEFRSSMLDDGPVAARAVLYTNDPDRPVVKLKLEGRVESPLRLTPKIPQFQEIRRDSARPFLEVRVERKDGQPVGPLRVTPPAPFVRVETSAEPSGEALVRLTLDPAAPMGPLLGWVRMETQHPAQPVVEVPIRAMVVGDLRPRPGHFAFELVDEGRSATATITIENQGSREVQVTRAEPRLPVTAEVTVTRSGKKHEVSVRLPAPSGLQNLNGSIDLFTDHPTEPVVTVRTEGWVVPKDPSTWMAGDQSKLSGLVRSALMLMDENDFSPKSFLNRFLGGSRDDRVVSFVLQQAQDENWRVRQRATQVLGVLGDPRALELIRRAVTDDVDEDVRRTAAMILAEIAGKDAVPVLVLALEDDDDWVRDDAARLLGELGDPRAVPALTRALQDEEEDVRATAEKALKALGGLSSEPRRP
jgi:hypothetical protein